MLAWCRRSNLRRGINDFNLAFGLQLELRTLSITPVEPNPVAFINAALMAVIVLLLVRSARIGFSDWRTRG